MQPFAEWAISHQDERLGNISARITIRIALLKREAFSIEKQIDKSKPRKGQQFWDWYAKRNAKREKLINPILKRIEILSNRQEKIWECRRKLRISAS